jgi:transposase-like protein
MIPSAPVVRLTSARGLRATVWLLEVRCPYCTRTHTHGGGGGRTRVVDFLGHRVSHCGRTDPDGVGYTITDPDGVLR